MKEHLFFPVQNHSGQLVINLKIKNLNKLISDINENPGTLFIWIKGLPSPEGELYRGDIKKLESVKHNENQGVFNINNDKIFISTNSTALEITVENLKLTNQDELKLLYARSNVNMVGIYNYSIFHTFRNRIFRYARPVFASEVITSELAPHILHDYYIIPKENEQALYGRVIEEDEGYLITLTNDKMIEFDLKYLNGELKEDDEKLYRPYFYEFFVDDQQITDDLKVKLETFYKITLSFDDGKKDVSRKGGIFGEVLFSASPPIQIPAYLNFLMHSDVKSNQELISQIKMDKKLKEVMITCNNKKLISDHFFKKIPSTTFKPTQITVYDIGQGNWIKIRLASKSKAKFDIVFDVGRSRRRGTNDIYVENAKKAAKELHKNSMFVLSHWDLDHIQGLSHLTMAQLETQWLVPELPALSNLSEAAKRLSAFIALNSNIDSLFVSESLNGEVIFDNQHFKLGKGHGNGASKKVTIDNKTFKTRYTKQNNLGLILAIQGSNEQKILLTGDCEYIQMPQSFLEEYHLMVASHHGAKTDMKNLLPNSNSPKKKEATVTVDENSSYPKCCHQKELERAGYSVITTASEGNKTWKIKDL